MASFIQTDLAGHRADARAKATGSTPVWSLDPRGAGFADECRRQALLVAESDWNDRELEQLLDALFLDVFQDLD